MTIKNTGDADLMNVTVTDVDHPGLDFVEEADYGDWIYLGDERWTYDGNVSVGETVILKIKITVNMIGVLNNTANVTVNNKFNETPTDNVTSVPWSTTTIIGPNATFSPGENITIDVTVKAEDGALLNGTVKVDKDVSDLFMECAEELNIHCLKGMVPPLGGATDSAAFAKAGMRATGITGLNHNLQNYYHTRRDTYDNMNLDGLADCFAVSVKVLEKFDNGAKQ